MVCVALHLHVQLRLNGFLANRCGVRARPIEVYGNTADGALGGTVVGQQFKEQAVTFGPQLLGHEVALRGAWTRSSGNTATAGLRRVR